MDSGTDQRTHRANCSYSGMLQEMQAVRTCRKTFVVMWQGTSIYFYLLFVEINCKILFWTAIKVVHILCIENLILSL